MASAKRNDWPLNLATFISNFGDGMHTLAIGQLLYERTGQVAAFGLIIALNYLIGVFCQIGAGYLADRFARSRLVKCSDVARGLLVLALAAGVGLGWPVLFITLVSLLIKVGTQLYRPAYQAMIADAISVERLSSFNAKNVACMQGGQLLGMAFFGVVYALGPASVFVADAMTFFFSAAIVQGLSIPRALRPGPARVSVLDSWLEAFRHVRVEKGLLLHILLSASIFLIYPIEEISVVPINMLRFGGDKLWLSLMNATFSIGCIVSMLIMKYRDSEESAHLWMLIQTAFLALLAVSGNSKAFALAAYFGMGVASTMATIQLLNRLIKRCPQQLQGRISALRYICISLLIAVTVPFLTLMFSRGLGWGLGFASLVMAAFAVIATLTALRGSFLGDATVLGRHVPPAEPG